METVWRPYGGAGDVLKLVLTEGRRPGAGRLRVQGDSGGGGPGRWSGPGVRAGPGDQGPRRASKLTPAVVARIAELDGQGMSRARIAAACGVPESSVAARCVRPVLGQILRGKQAAVRAPIRRLALESPLLAGCRCCPIRCARTAAGAGSGSLSPPPTPPAPRIPHVRVVTDILTAYPTRSGRAGVTLASRHKMTMG